MNNEEMNERDKLSEEFADVLERKKALLERVAALDNEETLFEELNKAEREEAQLNKEAARIRKRKEELDLKAKQPEPDLSEILPSQVTFSRQGFEKIAMENEPGASQKLAKYFRQHLLKQFEESGRRMTPAQQKSVDGYANSSVSLIYTLADARAKGGYHRIRSANFNEVLKNWERTVGAFRIVKPFEIEESLYHFGSTDTKYREHKGWTD